MTGQEEVGNALLDSVFVLAAAAHQLATLHAGLHEKRVQVLERLRRLTLLSHHIIGFRCSFWQIGETKL